MVIFQFVNQLFRVFDMFITSHISSTAVSAVAFFNQITSLFSALCDALPLGAGIIIAGYYGAGNYEKVKKLISSIFVLVIIISFSLSALFICGSPLVMKITNAPQDIQEAGYSYYIVQMITFIFVSVNTLFIVIEKAKGNGKKILWINLLLAITKFCFSYLFVIVLQIQDTMMVAIATLIANIIVTIFSSLSLFKKNDVFSISFVDINLRWSFLKETVMMSLPILAEKFAFSYGKVIVNSISVDYGSTTMGALGVSNNISGLNNMPTSSIGDGASAIMRQNNGANYKKRSLLIFRTIFIINSVFGIVSLIMTLIFLNPIIGAFAGEDPMFASLIKKIFLLEMYSNVLFAMTSAVLSLTYAFGYTKFSFLINFSRLFVFRLPSLFIFRHFTDLPGETVLGLIMLISNTLTGFLSLGIAIFIIKKEYGSAGLSLLLGTSKNFSFER